VNDSASRNPVLYIFSGLPGCGKSTLSRALARLTGAVHLRIDTIEQALHDLGHAVVRDEGYRIAYAIAADNLRLGSSVVADSCNPVAATRQAWERVATNAHATHVNIEVVCSDAGEHRRRVEARLASAPGTHEPGWQEVVQREYHPWTGDRIVIDTAGCDEAACIALLNSRLASLRTAT